MLFKAFLKSTRFFVLFHKTLDLLSPRVLDLFVFNIDVRVSQLKLKPKKCHKIGPHSSHSPSLSFSLSAQYASTTTEIETKKATPQKKRHILKIFETLKTYYIYTNSCTLHVQMPVARFGKTSKLLGCLFFKHNNLFLILSFLCSTANNVTKNCVAILQPGTVVDGKKFTHKRVSSV
jgi:hypothetical protein